MIKAGPAGDETRRSIFQTVVGRAKYAALSMEGKDTFIGDHAYFKAGILTWKYHWWFHYCLTRHLLGKGYHTQGVQRSWLVHCPPKVLINSPNLVNG